MSFGKAVINERRLDVYQRRVGYDLLRLSARMQVCCRNPSLLSRLRDCWWDLEDLHRRIELVIFNQPRCAVAASLMPCYQNLLCAYFDLESALSLVDCYHRHGEVHLYNSRVIPLEAPNRFYQPNLIESLLGAVVSSIDASNGRRCPEPTVSRVIRNQRRTPPAGSKSGRATPGGEESRQLQSTLHHQEAVPRHEHGSVGAGKMESRGSFRRPFASDSAKKPSLSKSENVPRSGQPRETVIPNARSKAKSSVERKGESVPASKSVPTKKVESSKGDTRKPSGFTRRGMNPQDFLRSK